MRLFFYGTLRDEDVRSCVLGRSGSGIVIYSACAPGWQAVYVRGKSYPVLVRAAGRAAPGLIAEAIDLTVLRKLKAFEVRYRLAQILVETDGRVDSAWVFLPCRGLRAGMAPFVLDAWRRRFKKAFLKRIRRRILGRAIAR